MNRRDFKGIAEKLQARLLASFPSVGIQASGGERSVGLGIIGSEAAGRGSILRVV